MIRAVKDESVKSKLLRLMENLSKQFLELKFGEVEKILTDIISIIDEELGKIEKLKI